MFKNYRLRDYDFKLIILVLALSVVGILTIGSAEPAQQNKQIAGVAVGLVIMIVLSFFNYSILLKLYWLMYIGNLVLLGLVILMGEEGNGAQRWLKIGGLQFQPSELAKILLILFFAQFIMKYKEKLNTFRVIALIAVLIMTGSPTRAIHGADRLTRTSCPLSPCLSALFKKISTPSDRHRGMTFHPPWAFCLLIPLKSIE